MKFMFNTMGLFGYLMVSLFHSRWFKANCITSKSAKWDGAFLVELFVMRAAAIGANQHSAKLRTSSLCARARLLSVRLRTFVASHGRFDGRKRHSEHQGENCKNAIFSHALGHNEIFFKNCPGAIKAPHCFPGYIWHLQWILYLGNEELRDTVSHFSHVVTLVTCDHTCHM